MTAEPLQRLCSREVIERGEMYQLNGNQSKSAADQALKRTVSAPLLTEHAFPQGEEKDINDNSELEGLFITLKEVGTLRELPSSCNGTMPPKWRPSDSTKALKDLGLSV